jgi:hypothetical protein
MTLGGIAAQAAPVKLPMNAISEDTFLIATVDLAKVDPTVLAATAKAALGEKAGDADEMLSSYKTKYEKFAGKGAESLTIILRGDPDQQKEPEPVFYVKFKADADHAAVEKQIREEEGEANPSPLEISNDGEFMVLRKKGVELPAAGSEERAKLFAEALGDGDKPAIGALIFNAAMIKSMQKDIGHGAPAGMLTVATDSKWLRMEMTLGAAVKAQVTIQTADEDAGKRVSDAVTGLGDFIKAQVAQMKQAFAQAPPQAVAQMGPIGDIADAMSAFAEAFKPTQDGTKVVVTADAKAVGGMLRGWFSAQKMQAQNAPGPKGGL